MDRLTKARQLVDAGQLENAERHYAEILDATPGETEATNFLSMRALSRGKVAQSIALFERAIQIKPNDSVLHRGLGLSFMQAGRLDEALLAFQRAITIDPNHHIARLLIGDVLNRLGHSHGALVNYFKALLAAQREGHWRDIATTPPWQREMVTHATAYVIKGRRALFSRSIQPLYERYGRDAMDRVELALATYLGDVQPSFSDTRQRPSFLFFPGLPTHPFFAAQEFAWVPELEARTHSIRRELEAVLNSGDRLEPFHQISLGETAKYLRGTSAAPAWDTYFFYRHGTRLDDHAERCPQTLSALEAMPLTRIREHAPESLYSILRPGTEILPHRGVTNTRLVVHLPLIIPDDCALVVGGEKRVWEEGRVLIFDDTFEHEAWNRSHQTRVVLIADVWNPYLHEAEQAALADLIAAIGDFNQDCGIK
ncbi:MAG: aspartyl beta-hydroxylase [Nevskia sp.]|nr:aspartyl beta-hydroxylase [Nevskia sp.]